MNHSKLNIYCRFFLSIPCLSFFNIGQYFGEDLQFSELVNGAVEGRVVFAPDNPPSTSIYIIQWHFGTTLILSSQSDSTSIAAAYRDRVSFDRNTLALELWNLRLGDSGIYKLTVLFTDGHQLTGETSLQVFGESVKKMLWYIYHM